LRISFIVPSFYQAGGVEIPKGFSEKPRNEYYRVVEAAQTGQSVDWTRMNWDLYSSVPGHSAVARKLTSKAKAVYKA
jgi:hypothetical protein